MLDVDTYTHERGNTLTLIYIHGKSSTDDGGCKDETAVVASHQSKDGKIFHNHIIDGNFFEGRLAVLIKTYVDRGYKLGHDFVSHNDFCQEESWDEDEV